jgi:hypothetical protein
LLPARFDDAGNLALQRQRPEAQTADAELAQESPRTSAQLAPVVFAAAELRLPRVFHSLCSRCHKTPSRQLLAFSYQLSAISSFLLKPAVLPAGKSQSRFASNAGFTSIKLKAES